MINLCPTQVCTICQEAKPYPGHYIVSYNTMQTSTQCRDCRSAKKRKRFKETYGNTEKKAAWSNSNNKFYKF